MSEVPQFLQRLEARIALALSRAIEGFNAFTAGANHVDAVLGSSTAPGNPVNFSLAGFTPKSGKVRVLASVTVQAGAGSLADGDQLSMVIERDGTPFPAGTPAEVFNTVAVGGAANGTLLTLAADDSSTDAPHTYTAHVACSNGGHTFVLSAPGTSMIVQELPG